MRGRKPLALSLKFAEGNRSKKPGNNAKSFEIPESIARPLKEPDWLDADARLVWAEIVPTLETLGHVCRADSDVLAMYCRTFARWKQLEQTLTEHGSTYLVTGKSGDTYQRARPEAQLASTLLGLLLRLAEQIGASPASRNRITPAWPAQPTDKRPRLLAGPKQGGL